MITRLVHFCPTTTLQDPRWSLIREVIQKNWANFQENPNLLDLLEYLPKREELFYQRKKTPFQICSPGRCHDSQAGLASGQGDCTLDIKFSCFALIYSPPLEANWSRLTYYLSAQWGKQISLTRSAALLPARSEARLPVHSLQFKYKISNLQTWHPHQEF